MNLFTKYTILPVLLFCVQDLSAQSVVRTSVKPGFELRIHNTVNDIRLIDTHEHLMGEKEALANAADFSCLFTNYQLSDLISSGILPEKIYNIFKGKDVSIEDKWAVIRDGWENIRSTAYGRGHPDCFQRPLWY